MILGEEEEEKGVGMGACRRGRLVRRRSIRSWVSWLEEWMWKGGRVVGERRRKKKERTWWEFGEFLVV
jgi:hypothetical protein